jgi:hypothetical protein
MTPYHTRSQLFVRERFSKAVLSHLDTAEIEAYIEHTQFPVPAEEQHAPTDDFPGLLRAADLIGQLADINYLRKTSALFSEFRETGISTKLNFNSAADLRANYPHFFWQIVRPYLVDALRYLRVTQEGQQWIANLYANVFLMEHWGADSLVRSNDLAKQVRLAGESFSTANLASCWPSRRSLSARAVHFGSKPPAQVLNV